MDLISVAGLSVSLLAVFEHNLYSHKNSIKGLKVVNLLSEKDFIEYVYLITALTGSYRTWWRFPWGAHTLSTSNLDWRPLMHESFSQSTVIYTQEMCWSSSIHIRKSSSSKNWHQWSHMIIFDFYWKRRGSGPASPIWRMVMWTQVFSCTTALRQTARAMLSWNTNTKW